MSGISRKGFLAGSAGAAATFAAQPVLAQDQRLASQITIGVVVPLSGPQQRQGEQVADGVRAAVAQANRLVGMLDHSFGMRTFDDENSIATGIMNAQFAGDDPNMIAAVGHLSSVVTDACLQQYANAKMALIVPASSADSITQHGYRNVFRLPTKDSTEGQLFAHYLANGSQRPKAAVALAQDGDYGFEVARAFAAQASNEKITANLVVYANANPNLSEVVKKTLAFAPDYIFLAGNTDAMGPIMPALRAAGYKGAFGASQGFYNLGTVTKYAGEFGNGLISTSMPPLDRVPSAFQDLSELRARYGEVTPLSAFGYAAAQLVVKASQRTGSTNRLSLINALTNTGSYETLVGTFSFLQTGDPIDPNLYFYSITGDGKLKYAGAAHSSSFLL